MSLPYKVSTNASYHEFATYARFDRCLIYQEFASHNACIYHLSLITSPKPACEQLIILWLILLTDSAQRVATPWSTWPQIQSLCQTFLDGLSLRLANNKTLQVTEAQNTELRLVSLLTSSSIPGEQPLTRRSRSTWRWVETKKSPLQDKG